MRNFYLINRNRLLIVSISLSFFVQSCSKDESTKDLIRARAQTKSEFAPKAPTGNYDYDHWGGLTNRLRYYAEQEYFINYGLFDDSASTVFHPSLTKPILVRGGTPIFSKTSGYIRMILQTDGNLVLYKNSTGEPLWDSKTQGSDAQKLIFQTDLNLVLLDSKNRPVWSSGIYNTSQVDANLIPDHAVCVMQDDGNFAIDWVWTNQVSQTIMRCLGSTGTQDAYSSNHNGKLTTLNNPPAF